MNKSKKSNNKMKIILGSAVAAIAVIILTIFLVTDSRLIYIGNSEMQLVINDMSGEGNFVYIGSPSCPVCNEFRPTVETVLRSLDARLLYFETDAAGAENRDRMIDILGQINITGTPTIIYIENGVVIETINRVGSNDLTAFFARHNGLSE